LLCVPSLTLILRILYISNFNKLFGQREPVRSYG
jgi:hypothetical protein